MRFGIINGEVNDLWAVAHDSGELGSAVTSYNITGLEGNTDIEYQLIIRMVNGYNGGVGGSVRLNGDSSNNYGNQRMVGTDGSVTAIRSISNRFMMFDMEALNDVGFAEMHIFAKSDKERTAITQSCSRIQATTVGQLMGIGSCWNNTGDEVTSITFYSNVTDGLGVGTRIILLKKVHNNSMKTGVITPNKIVGAWERIYSNTLTSNTTTVSITGLEGNIDQIYWMVFRGIGAVVNTTLNFRFNNDSGTNYGRQFIKGLDSTVSAGRVITTVFQNPELHNLTMFNDNLIYAKAGYERTVLSTWVQKIDGTTINELFLNSATWNNTVSEITSIGIFSDETNGIGIGTNLELWRLNL